MLTVLSVVLLTIGVLPATAAPAVGRLQAGVSPAIEGPSGPVRPLTSTGFTDVPPGSMFYTEIGWLAGQGISTGWLQPDGTRLYGPVLPVARDAMAAFMYRLAGSPTFTAPAVSPFTDITPSTQFYKEITWLAAKGISTGWPEPDGSRTYRPLLPVARDAMAAFMYRFAGSPASTTAGSSFTDVGTANIFYNQIMWLSGQGISTGWAEADGTRTYRPLNPVNRDAMAAFMYRLHQKLVQACAPPVTHLSGSLPVDVTLDPACSPVFVLDSNLTVEQGATLHIGAGTVLQAAQGATLVVKGSLVVDGSATAPVVFTSTQDSAALPAAVAPLSAGPRARPAVAAGQWTGVQLQGGGSVSASYLTVRYASTGLSAQSPVSPSTTTKLSLDSTSFSDAGTCLSLQGPVVGHFHGSVAGCPVGVSGDSPFDASSVDWGGGPGPGDAGSGRPSLQGVQITVYPWMGAAALLPPQLPSGTTNPSACGDYYFIAVMGSGERDSSTSDPYFGPRIEDVYGGFQTAVHTVQPQAVIRGQGIDYPANPVPFSSLTTSSLTDLPEYVPGAWQGALDVLDAIANEESKCGSSGEKIVLSGYSQGAWAIHVALNYAVAMNYANASNKIDLTRIAAIGLLADPQRFPDGGETHLGTAAATGTPLGQGIANALHVAGGVYSFVDWATRLNDPTGLFKNWQPDPNTPMSSMLYGSSIPATLQGITGSFCNLHDPVCSYGDNGSTMDWAVHSYDNLTDRTVLGRWIASTALVTRFAPVPLTAIRTVVTDTADANSTSAYAIGTDGTVHAWGTNTQGQLGNGTTTSSPVPVTVHGLTNVQSVSVLCGSVYAIKTDGTLWAWGWNYYGQLGDGTYTAHTTPQQVTAIIGTVTSVVTNCDSVYALTADGTVWSWGRNMDGQLGNGTTTDSPTPRPISTLTGVSQLAGGNEVAYAVKNDGTVWTWGAIIYGTAGNTPVSAVPVKVNIDQVQTLTVNPPMPAAPGNVLATRTDGSVWVWGTNASGELGLGTTGPVTTPVPNPYLTGVRDITVGGTTNYALKTDGTVLAWGTNSYGELGNGTTSNTAASPVPAAVFGLTGITSLSSSGRSTFAFNGSGQIFGWGYNTLGEIGNGTNIEAISVPASPTMPRTFASVITSVGSTYAVGTDGTVWAWGYNRTGQLGNATNQNASIPVQVGWPS